MATLQIIATLLVALVALVSVSESAEEWAPAKIPPGFTPIDPNNGQVEKLYNELYPKIEAEIIKRHGEYIERNTIGLGLKWYLDPVPYSPYDMEKTAVNRATNQYFLFFETGVRGFIDGIQIALTINASSPSHEFHIESREHVTGPI